MTSTAAPKTRLIDELSTLHDDYVERINLAIAHGDLDRAQSLAVEFDHEALMLVATHEDRLEELETIQRRAAKDTPLRRWARSLRLVPAA